MIHHLAQRPRMKALRPRASWVLVAAGFYQNGGMDRANAALAHHLIATGTPIHLVTHRAEYELLRSPLVTVHRVPKLAGSYFLGDVLIDRVGRAVARRVTQQWPAARVLVNGGCCCWPGVNWVHYVHHAWTCAAPHAPAWFRLKHRAAAAWSRRQERKALQAAAIVIADSGRTRNDVLDHFHLDRNRVQTVYYGADADLGPASRLERLAARQWLGVAPNRPLVAFVGDLAFDNRKGLDTLWTAWRKLCAEPAWDADLVIAGGGRSLPLWRACVAAAGLERRVRLLGFTERVPDLLAAADVLVSPVRYEPYGLNVHEAICRGLPAIVSAVAGVAECYPAELSPLLLPDAEDTTDLAVRLRAWRQHMYHWQQAFTSLAASLRRRSWSTMAAHIVEIVDRSLEPQVSHAG